MTIREIINQAQNSKYKGDSAIAAAVFDLTGRIGDENIYYNDGSSRHSWNRDPKPSYLIEYMSKGSIHGYKMDDPCEYLRLIEDEEEEADVHT